MDENTYGKIVQFFVTFVIDFCKKSTARELPNMLTVYNIYQGKNSNPGHSSAHLNDNQLADCIRSGLEYVRRHLQQMQNLDNGIPVAGGSIESWKFENIALDIISQDTKLHQSADYEIESVDCSITEGRLALVVRWPQAHLTETYILRGAIDNKKVFGAGNFRITVTNFMLSARLKWYEDDTRFKMQDVFFNCDFDDAMIAITGLEVEGNENAEQLMNNAIQRDKQKFREILQRNMEMISHEVLVVLNLKLSQTNKNTVLDLVSSWCRLG